MEFFMSATIIAQKSPIPTEVEEDKSYFRCTFVKSGKNPCATDSIKELISQL